MAKVSAQDIVEAGLDATYTAAAADQTFENGPGIFLHVKTGGTACDVTVAAIVDETTKPGFGTLDRADVAVSLGATDEQFIGPFPLTAFTREPGIAYSATTNVTVAVLRLP